MQKSSSPPASMAPMGIRLSPLGVAVFCLLGLGVIYHLYAGVLSNRMSTFSKKKKVDLRDLLAVAVEAAVLGGEEVKRVREENTLNEKSKGKTKEGANDPLTMGDVMSHRKMFNLLKNTFPDVKVISEEFDTVVEPTVLWSRDVPADILNKIERGREVLPETLTVWVDPLDATQEYTENLSNYVTTMVCVALEGKPVIGVIHQPFTGFTAWAYVGQGSNMEARSSYNSPPAKVIVSRSHAGKVTNFVQKAFGTNTTIIPAGGSGYKVLSLLQMPEGSKVEKADVYIHVTFIKKWDICAGTAILNALGGHLTTLKGENIDYSGSPSNEGGLVASVGMDHKALVKRLPEMDFQKN